MIQKETKNLIAQLWPINRSITGKGLFKSLKIIKKRSPFLQIKSFKSGTKCFNWKIPKVWEVNEAYLLNENNKKIIDFKQNNLQIINYCAPFIKKNIPFNDLKKNLYFLKKQRNAIPYVTSYYERRWGFCLKYNDYLKLNKKDKYTVQIDTSFKNGLMHYGEYYQKGKTKKEILITTYLCHPSMGNNELSGPTVITFLMNFIKKIDPYYSYRFIIIPETIGSIAFISKNLKKLQKNVLIGFCLTCLGGKGTHSFIPSKNNESYVNFLLNSFFKFKKIKNKKYNWLDRGSDERQFSSPLVDIPFATIFKTKFGEYKEYHTSLDDKRFLEFNDLKKSFNLIKGLIKTLETKRFPILIKPCEPFLSKYKLHRSINIKSNYFNKDLLNILSYCDGQNDIELISNKCFLQYKIVKRKLNELLKLKIIKFI